MSAAPTAASVPSATMTGVPAALASRRFHRTFRVGPPLATTSSSRSPDCCPCHLELCPQHPARSLEHRAKERARPRLERETERHAPRFRLEDGMLCALKPRQKEEAARAGAGRLGELFRLRVVEPAGELARPVPCSAQRVDRGAKLHDLVAATRERE
jgi:hypothetical protein